MKIDWHRLFPDSDFRHPMNMQPGDLGAFFATEDRALLDKRRRWFGDADEAARYVAADGGALDALHEFAGTFGFAMPSELSADAVGCAAFLGRKFEADWVMIRADRDSVFRLNAGAVCFPSGWSLPEKVGETLDAIHDIVPGLNEALGRQINAFFAKMASEKAFARANWGLSADRELNHHPARDWKRMCEDAALDATWIRLERQILYKLPRSSAILFGIRVSIHPLADVCAETGLSARIARALATMPEDVAEYKGFARARAALIAQLKAVKSSQVRLITF